LHADGLPTADLQLLWIREWQQERPLFSESIDRSPDSISARRAGLKSLGSFRLRYASEKRGAETHQSHLFGCARRFTEVLVVRPYLGRHDSPGTYRYSSGGPMGPV
jgi:hypothetical protein